MELSLKDHIEKHLFWYGYYEKNEIGLLLNLVQDGAVIMDVGANIGYVSLLVSSHCPKSTVIAIEPGPSIMKKLKRNLALNKLENVKVLEKAVGASEGYSQFFESGSDNLGMSGLTPAENHIGHTTEVCVTTIDQVFSELKLTRLDLVKIDVEGAEIQVLKGMKQVISTQRPWILVEVCSSNLKRFESNAEAIYELMELANYQPYRIISPLALQPLSEVTEASLICFKPVEKKLPSNIRIIEFN